MSGNEIEPLRLCLDCNSIVSGLISPNGAAGVLVRTIAARQSRLLLTSEIEQEYLHTVLRGRIRARLGARHRVQEALDLVAELRAHAELVSLSGEPPPCRDEKDRKYLHCAVSGHADFLISSDDDLLDMGTIEDIPILRPSVFVALCRENGWPLAG